MIVAYAPATVSNVGCGFDVLGFALEEPGDLVGAAIADESGVRITNIDGDGGRLARDVARNTAGAAARALLDRLGTVRGVALTIQKGLPIASGIGSSGASAVAAVVAVNELFGRPAPLDLLLECAMEGERAGCGASHPDNVAPALYGGFVLARNAQPPDIVRLPVPEGLACAVLHPHVEIQTREARAILGDSVPLVNAVRQSANLGALVAGLFTNDLGLVSRAMVDHIAEPKRSALVPALDAVKDAARAAGAIGAGLSGSGPSIFALASSLDAARTIGAAMHAAFAAAARQEADLWVSAVARRGARIVTV